MTSTIDQRGMLLRAIEAKETSYNPEVRMLRSPFSSPGYHTTIKQADSIHSTYKSLVYALGLLDTEEERYAQRAFDIIGQLASMQDKDPSSATFGIWSWFYEESLEQMSPPDWNWADFCGKVLVLSVLRHGHRFPESLREKVRETIGNACDAIIRRNVGPEYTNIAIMGTLVTLIAGELYEREDYGSYGMQRLERIVAFTRDRQTFQEYNSPTYTYVALLELSKLSTSTRNPEAKRLANELIDMAWGSVAQHFHASTRNWAGPHSRSYRTMLSDEHKAFLQLATEGALSFFSWEELPYDEGWYRVGFSCPERFREQFLTAEIRNIRECYEPASDGEPDKWAVTYMTETYALGSFSREILWNQRRALLLYADNGGEPTYAHFRCLHDGYDFCSAVIHSVQEAGEVLFGVSFLTNGGDTHPNLDWTEGVIEASDFRLRLELGGCLDGVEADVQGDRATVRIGGLTLRLVCGHAVFGEGLPREWSIESDEEDGRLFVDLPIYAGQPKRIDLRALDRAAFLFALSVDGEDSAEAPQIAASADRLEARVRRGGRELAVTLPLRPVER
ncbi:hypothetical protein J4772_05115 [Cohnella sp. LGH]|uniref:hypothetical protein n=1 Tax=Cohnella sp. LGH TaxID=1619153 RepID=UPI001ADD2A81|nr:hypothetical protein [Cohnella sp. LGH]QTH43801.1 hypothetical protein J4772_05115 [Cohnella sp. LGH]